MARKILMAAANANSTPFVDELFQIISYTGNGGVQSLPVTVDLKTHGGMLWMKPRNAANIIGFVCQNTEYQYDKTTGFWNVGAAGPAGFMYDNTVTFANFANQSLSNSLNLNSSVSNGATTNTNGQEFLSLLFRRHPRFFWSGLYSGNNTAGRSIPHTLTVPPGMVIIKRTDVANDWFVQHRSMPATSRLFIDSTGAAVVDATSWNNTAMSSSGVVVGNNAGVNATGGFYSIMLFGHDTAPDGVIQSGSFTTSGSVATVTLGWEPQFLLYKDINNAATNWVLVDAQRGFGTAGSTAIKTFLNSVPPVAETTDTLHSVTATGFTVNTGANSTYIYVAIRRSNKPPSFGTEVYKGATYTGNGTTIPATLLGMSPDLYISKARATASDLMVADRMRGQQAGLFTASTAVEDTAQGWALFDRGTGVYFGNSTSYTNTAATTYINYGFKRARFVMDMVAYTGTGLTHLETHQLGRAPELIIFKRRNVAANWVVNCQLLPTPATAFIVMNASNGPSTDSTLWDTAPTATQFQVKTNNAVNANTGKYMAYMFASLDGVSKIGTYVGNNGSLTVNCNFTTGARWIMIKRIDAVTGDWYVWDSSRGITASFDPWLAWNATTAETTTDDSIGLDVTGFSVNQLAATNINVSGITYLFMAFS